MTSVTTAKPLVHAKALPWIYVILALLVVSLLAVPIVEKTPNALAFETFYLAGQHWLQGLDPYAVYEGYDFYKLSPTFLLPLIGFAQLPFVVSAVLWQFLSIALFALALVGLLRYLPLNQPLSLGWSLFLPFLLLTDFQLNGTYLQSNTLVVSVMVLGWLAYVEQRWILAALLLAWVSNMKLYPLVLMLMLFVDWRWRFIVASLLAHLLLLLLPFMVWGQAQSTLLYDSWLERLLMDKTITYGEPWGHFFLGLKPFLEVNFGWVLHQGYGVVLLVSALWVAAPVLLLRRVGNFSMNALWLLLVTALAWILLFSTRTEGPTLVLIAPIYAYALWWIMQRQSIRLRRFGLWLLVLTFVLTSLSTSDLFRGSIIHELSWQHNLRAIGLMIAFAFTSVVLWLEALATIRQTPATKGYVRVS